MRVRRKMDESETDIDKSETNESMSIRLVDQRETNWLL